MKTMGKLSSFLEDLLLMAFFAAIIYALILVIKQTDNQPEMQGKQSCVEFPFPCRKTAGAVVQPPSTRYTDDAGGFIRGCGSLPIPSTEKE